MKKYRDYIKCMMAICILSLLFTKRYSKDDSENLVTTSISYEDGNSVYNFEKKSIEDTIQFNFEEDQFNSEEDVLSYSDSNFFNLLIPMYFEQAAIRTDIHNDHILYLNALDRMMYYKRSHYIGIQYNGYIDLLWDWDLDNNVDKLIDARLTAEDFAHKIYADDVFIDVYPDKEVTTSKSDTYFKYVYINPAFQSTRMDEEGMYYHVIFYSLTKDKSAINFAKEDDCYVPSDLEVKISENGIIYGEGVVSRHRCEELLAEYLRAWLKVFEPEQEKGLRLENTLEGPQMNL